MQWGFALIDRALNPIFVTGHLWGALPKPPGLPGCSPRSRAPGFRHSCCREQGAERPKRVLVGPRTPKGPVDCLHQFRCRLLSSQERLSLQAPLRGRHRTRRHRGPTRSRRDRSRYLGRMSRRWLTTRRRAATPRNLRGRLVPLTTISACRLPHREHTSRSRQSGTGVSAPYRAAISAGRASAQRFLTLPFAGVCLSELAGGALEPDCSTLGGTCKHGPVAISGLILSKALHEFSVSSQS